GVVPDEEPGRARRPQGCPGRLLPRQGSRSRGTALRSTAVKVFASREGLPRNKLGRFLLSFSSVNGMREVDDSRFVLPPTSAALGFPLVSLVFSSTPQVRYDLYSSALPSRPDGSGEPSHVRSFLAEVIPPA